MNYGLNQPSNPISSAHHNLQQALSELNFTSNLPKFLRRRLSSIILEMSKIFSGMLRSRLLSSARTRGGGGHGHDAGHGLQEKPNGYILNRTPPPPGESRKWEDWELPCYLTSFLTIVILGVGLNAKPDLTLETWAHQKALERLQQQEQAGSAE